MGTTSKITGTLATAISKVSGTVISGLANIMGQTISLFTNANSVAKSLTTGTAQAIYVADSNSMGVEWDDDDDFSISFWIKPGWNTSLNTNIHLFSMTNAGGAVNSDTFRIWYDDSNNRLNVQWRSGGSHRYHNFWTFHSNSGKYAPAYAAAGLGTTYWNSGNRGYVGDDDYTLITFCKGTANSAADTNIDMYWNGTTLGTSHYTNGNHTGTPDMGNDDKQIFLGSSSWSPYQKSGNNTETKYDGLTMWDTKLSASDVTELWNGGTPINATTHSAADSYLKGYWEFESDGTATVGENMAINGDSNIETR